MTSSGSKARYYLEQCVPELKDLEKKKIFSADELSKIMRRRTDYEHRICARGAKKIDFLRYAEYEMNVEELRRRRVKRLDIRGKPTVSDWAGQRRVFFIYDRATQKFPGDIGIWLQYVSYAKKEKSPKVLAKVFAHVIQMHPTNPSVWILAAQHEFEENANMPAARRLMQRALRFNKESQLLWLEYGKLEMAYVDKLHKRRKLLGVDEKHDSDMEDIVVEDGQVIQLANDGQEPDPINNTANLAVLRAVHANPALSGAVIGAIFEAAVSEFKDLSFATSFYDLLLAHDELPKVDELKTKVHDYIDANSVGSDVAQAFLITLPLREREMDAAAGASALRQTLSNFNEVFPDLRDRINFVSEYSRFMHAQYMSLNNPDLKKVIRSNLLKTFRLAEERSSLPLPIYKMWLSLVDVNEERARLLARANMRFPDLKAS